MSLFYKLLLIKKATKHLLFTATSTWTWIDHPVSGLLRLTLRPIQTWFPFGSTPSVLNLASQRNSPDRSTKSTRLSI